MPGKRIGGEVVSESAFEEYDANSSLIVVVVPGVSGQVSLSPLLVSEAFWPMVTAASNLPKHDKIRLIDHNRD